MAAKSDKVIITCAVTGAIHTPTMSDALPVTPDQIAEQAIGAAEAGAAILHLHARDPQNGRPTGDPKIFMEFLPRIKQATDAVVNITTGGSPTMPVEERLAGVMKFSPEMCSLNMGSMNFALYPMAARYKTWKYDWEEPYLLGTDTTIFSNTFRDIERISKLMGEGHGTKFEHECYDTGHLYNLAHGVDKGWFKPPIFLQLIFGILGGIGADMDNLAFMKRTADKLFGDDYQWSVLGAGRQPDSVRHPGGDDGRQRPRRPGGLALHRPRQAGDEQRRAGRQDAPDHRGTGLPDRDPEGGARDARPQGTRPHEVLGSVRGSLRGHSGALRSGEPGIQRRA